MRFPDAEQCEAIFRDARELPGVAKQEARRLANMGKVSGVDRVRGGLRVVGVSGDGELTGAGE